MEFPALSLVAIREWKEKRRGQQRVERGQVEKGQQSDKTGSQEKRERWVSPGNHLNIAL